MDIRATVRRWASGSVPLLTVVITLLAFLLRFYGLDDQPLWYDELIGMDMALYRDGLVGVWTAKYYPHPPLFVALLQLVLRGLAPSEFSARLLAAFGGVLALPFFYRAVTDWANRRVALAGMVLLALSPFHIYFSQESRPYALIFTMVLVTMWVLHRALQSNRAGWWVAHALSILVLLYLHFINWAIVGGEVLFMLVYWRRYKRSLLPFVLSLCLAPLAIPPVFNLFRESRAAGQMHVLNAIPYTVSFPETWKTLVAGETRYVGDGLRLWGALAFGLLAVAGAVRLWRSRRSLLVLILSMLLVPTVFVFVVLPALGQVVPSYEEKLFVICLPFALVLAASGIEALVLQAWQERAKIVAGMVGVVAALILLGSNVLALGAYYGPFVKNAEIPVIRSLEARVAAGDLILMDSLSMAVNSEYHWDSEVTVELVTRAKRAGDTWLFSTELRPLPSLGDEGVEWDVTLDDVLAHPRVWLISLPGFENPQFMEERLAAVTPTASEQIGPFLVYLLEP